MSGRTTRAYRQWIAAAVSGVFAYVVLASTVSPARASDLGDLSLEELMEIEITSVAKKPQPRSRAPAAIFVLTGEDIRRSGARTIPDLLRLVPGVHVARIDANRWAISVRGFSGRFTNKLLVLIDGRSVYTPLFGGVYWESQDTLLEDIERIEVIRGPGGSVWGANAVNGVINIITKNARQTVGGLATGGAGTEENGFAALRYGAELSPGRYVRGYAKLLHRDGGGGGGDYDAWTTGRVGFRGDFSLAHDSQLSVHGDGYYGELGQRVQPFAPAGSGSPGTIDADTIIAGGFLLARWDKIVSSTSEFSLQGWLDGRHRKEPIFRNDRTTVDLSFEHRLALPLQQDFVYGLSYRVDADEFDGSPSVDLDPEKRNVQQFSGFFHDEIRLRGDHVRLVVGTKLEHNDFTGFEFQPMAGLVVMPWRGHTLWGSVARAVRIPSRSENDVFMPLNVRLDAGATVAEIHGNTGLSAENLLAYEIGYRCEIDDLAYLDTTLFFHDYDELITIVPAPIGSGSGIGVPFRFENGNGANVYGLEISGSWQARPWWRLHAAYSLLQANADAADGASPKNQASLRSMIDIGDRWEFDAVFRYVDSLTNLGVDSYVGFDLRIAYLLTDQLRLELVGRDLLEDEHREFRDFLFNPQSTTVERSVYAQATWRF